MHVNYICDYQEQTSERPENQLAEPQVINYLQEAVRDDKDLNHLRHREMPRITEGKVKMSLGRYIEALVDLGILTDQSNPRKNASDGRRSPRNAHRLEIEPDYGDDQDSEDEEDSVGESAMSYLIHRVVSKNTTGHISPEKWDKLNVETRRTLRGMTPEKRQELHESPREDPTDSGGPREVNNAESSTSDTEDSVKPSSETVVADGDRVVQQAARDMNKAKKAAKAAALYKKAGNSRSDAHPADARKMMSQPKGKQKRSGFMAKWKPSLMPLFQTLSCYWPVRTFSAVIRRVWSDARSSRLSEKEWLVAKRVMQKSNELTCIQGSMGSGHAHRKRYRGTEKSVR